MMRWYMTTELKGGQYAARAESLRDFIDRRGPEILADLEWVDTTESLFRFARPCPPDVVDWIEAEMHTNDAEHHWRQKASCGWLYDYAGGAFIPVPGTENLTILEESE